MFSLGSFTLAISAISAVSGLVVPRRTPPAGWRADILEPYDEYNAHYMAIGCKSKHNTDFFAKCCHPRLKSLENDRPLECRPLTSSVIDVKPSPTTPVDEDDLDCDDEDVHPVTPTHSQVPPAVTPTPPPVLSSTKAPAPTTSTKAPATPTSKPPPPPENNSGNNGGAGVNKGGFATFFYQHGVAGACGKVHMDSDFVVAMDYRRYGNLSLQSALCGKQVKITNPENNKSVTATIADACPTCRNGNSIDLSKGAFDQIAREVEGMVPIAWTFV